MQDMLRADSRTATSSRRTVAARSVQVISQLAVSVILLVGALLLIRSYPPRAYCRAPLRLNE